jgi:hypothetical protein
VEDREGRPSTEWNDCSILCTIGDWGLGMGLSHEGVKYIMSYNSLCNSDISGLCSVVSRSNFYRSIPLSMVSYALVQGKGIKRIYV